MTWSRSSWYWKLRLASALAISGTILTSGDYAFAQITPDNTLPTNSRVTSLDNFGFPVDQINDGTVRGTNLFHSFLEFNVSEGRGAYFTNPVGIENILSRVTGSNPSNILGTLGVVGNANLFLMNPNGVIFGPNASLDVGGSFVATTANAIQLGEAGQFSASEPVTSNLLAVNPSALFFNALANQAEIVNRSTATSTVLGNFPLNAPPGIIGLQVLEGQSLLLVGGDVVLEGGSLTAPGGQIELGSVVNTGQVSLSPVGESLILGYEGVQNFGNIQLSQFALLDTSNSVGGEIRVQGERVSLTGNSQIVSNSFSDTKGRGVYIRASQLDIEDGAFIGSPQFGLAKSGDVTLETDNLTIRDGAFVTTLNFSGEAGNLVVSAADSINVTNSGFISADAFGTGAGGNISVETAKLNVDRGSIFADTTGSGKAGTVDIRATDSVEVVNGQITAITLLGEGRGGDVFVRTGRLLVSDRASISTETFGAGQGGALTIEAGRLSVSTGAQVGASTFGQGDAGRVTINAHNTVSLDGVDSAAASRVEPGAVGDGGSIDITTGLLSVTNGAVISASTFGQGDAGRVTINAHNTVSLDGVGSNGLPSAAASRVEPGAVGDGGSIDITTGLLSVTNGAVISARTIGQGDAGRVTINAHDIVSLDGVNPSRSTTFGTAFGSGVFSTVEDVAMGDGGSIDITTGSLSVTNGALVSTASTGQGDAGDIKANVRSLQLDNQGALTTETTSGNGGGIMLQVQDLLLLRRNSDISTTAGTAQAGGNGGDVTIDTDLLVALENSDIAANAFEGRGGNVRITTQEDFRSPDSNITASSAQGIEGVVEINTPDVDLQNSLTPLSANLVSPEQVVAGSCLARRNVEQGSFTVTGTGGLPRSPYEAISGQFSLAGVQPIQGNNPVSSPAAIVESAPWKPGDPIQEAQGMVVTADERTVVGTTPQLVALAKAEDLVCRPK